jgi:hypothetical protein
MNKKPQEYWQSTPGQNPAKGFLQQPSVKRTRELLRQVTGLLTGDCHLNGHLIKLGLTNSPICERYHPKEETASKVLCNHVALTELRFSFFVHFMK